MKNLQINRNNYEAYFLDFWENTLHAEGREAVSLFLQSNPDLQDEFLDFRDALNMKLNAKQIIVFPQKQHLKKIEVVPTENINNYTYEDFIIAQMEHDLDHDQVVELERFKALNPQLLPEFDLYAKTILGADGEVVFENKEELKYTGSTGKMVRFFSIISAIAALLFIAYVLVNPLSNQNSFSGITVHNNTHAIPDKPLPKLIPEMITKLPASKVVDQVMVADFPVDDQEEIVVALAERTNETDETNITEKTTPFSIRETVRLNPISMEFDQPVLASLPVQKMEVKPRTEMDGVFEYLMLREEMLAKNDQKKPGAIQRILSNLGDVVFGGGDEDQQSLLGQIAESGRERINEIRAEGPKLETIKTDQAKKTYFAINGNFRIMISKSNKPQVEKK